MKRLWRKLMRRRTLHRDLEAELAFHREMALAAGNPVPLGNCSVIQEQVLDVGRFNWIENLWRDLRFGARGLMRSPVVVLGALASLGLGIGVNTALFSLASEFLLSEPSVTGAGSIVSVRLGGNSHAEHGVADFLRESGVFASVTAEQAISQANWNNGIETRRVNSVITERNYFSALGVPVAMGRGYVESDAAEVVVLHPRFWRTRLNGDPNVLGRVLNLEGRAYTVVGVLRDSHRTLMGFGFSPDVYIPRSREEERLAIYARLKPGQSPQQALEGVRLVGARLDAERPDRHVKYARDCRVTPAAGLSRLTDDAETITISMFFGVLLTLAALVLLIACVNVAGLLLARAAARRREIAIRISVGASGARLVQQLLAESSLLAGLGAVAGLLFAWVSAALLAGVPLPLPLPVRLVIEPDWRVAAYAAVLTVIAIFACGLLPALQILKDSAAGDLQREPRQRLRRVLVVGQMAVSVMVLTMGFLFVRNMLNSGADAVGFDTATTIYAEVNLPPVTYDAPERAKAYIERAIQELEAVPGVAAVAAARIVPFNDAETRGGILTFPGSEETVTIRTHANRVSPGYFRAMMIPLSEGTTFSENARSDIHEVVVNHTFAKLYLGNRPAVGALFVWGGGKVPNQVVGVAAGTKNLTLGEGEKPQIYERLTSSGRVVRFVVRSALPPGTQLDAVRSALRRVEPAAGAEVKTLLSSIGLAFLPSQVGALLMGAIGVLGLLLAAVGLYGTLAYSVEQRRRAIAVRIAVGASRGDVVRAVLGDSMKLIAWGSAFGLLGAYFLTKPLAMFLVPGVEPGDPLNYVVAALVLALAGIAVALGPARRAASIDPASIVRAT